MHDISDNIYIKHRVNKLEGYTVNSFLHNELAIESKADIDEVVRAVYDILLSHGFHFQLNGCKYLASLATRYIIKSDYDEQKAYTAIALATGSSEEFVIGCINGSITHNKEFIPTARKTLRTNIPSNKTSITDVVMIIGAIFKVYFNYTVDSEQLEEDDKPAINFTKAVLNHGNSR